CLTDAGELVVARARRISAELDALAADVTAIDREVSGTVRVGMIGTTARWLVPELLSIIPVRFPLLRLVFVEATTAGLDAQLANGQVDLAVLNLPAAGVELRTVPLFEEDLVLVAGADDPLAGRESIDVAELDGMTLLLPQAGTAFRDEIDSALRPARVTIHPRAEVDSTRLIASLTFEGCGPAILPASAVPNFLRDQWALVPIVGMPPRIVGVALRRRGLLGAPARAVLDVITEVVFDSRRIPSGLRALTPDQLPHH
ncbi:MAG TPA: LysR family transcriptional regulator substrate-binding protein, partial [Acidimicrobiales bacterium]|nr:LysR family transcriptional regulator substrate-binding protein [Acidimicrobiales bacterium]